MATTTNYGFKKRALGHPVRDDDIGANLDLIDTAIASSPSAATFVVAASDSLHPERADYVCDGVDDQVEIQAAIDALPSGGGKVTLLEGNFILSRQSGVDYTFKIAKSNVELQGNGPSTILRLANNQAAPGQVAHVIQVGDGVNSYENIDISALMVDGNKDNQTGTPRSGCIFFNKNVTKSTVQKCTIKNALYEAVWVFYSSYNMIINNRIYDCAEGIDFFEGDHNIAEANVIYNITWQDALESENADYCSFVNNVIDIVPQSGIDVYNNSDYNIVKGNIIRRAAASCDAGIHVIGSKYAVIEGNIIEDSANVGIKIKDDSCIVIGNSILNTDGGINIDGRGTVITGNVILNSADYGIQIGSYGVDPPFKDTIVSGNRIESSASYAIFCYGITDSIISENIIRNNCLTSGDSEIQLKERNSGQHSKNNCIMGNRIITGCDYGIKEQDTGTDDNICTDNFIEGAAVSAIHLDGAHSKEMMYEQHVDLFMDVLAMSNVHVVNDWDVSASGPIELNPTASYQPDIPRTICWDIVEHTNVTEFDLVFTGKDAKGNTVSEYFTEAWGWGFETVTAFASITSVVYTRQAGAGDALNKIDIGIRRRLGLSNNICAASDVYKIKKNNANVAVNPARVNTAENTYDMINIGLAATDDFTIWYKSNLNIIS